MLVLKAKEDSNAKGIGAQNHATSFHTMLSMTDSNATGAGAGACASAGRLLYSGAGTASGSPSATFAAQQRRDAPLSFANLGQ